MKIELKSESIKETEKIGFDFAKRLTGKEIVMFYGDLGVGKTTFIKSLAKALDVKDINLVNSPTYNIMNCYTGKFSIYHFDMYRISTEEELFELGFFDYIGTGIILIEWSENIERLFPGKYCKERVIKIFIKYSEVNENFRNFKFIF